MFQVVTYCVPGKSTGAGKFRRPVDVVIIHGERPTRRKLAPWYRTVARNVDSRYAGKRAAYGQAITTAEREVDELNKWNGV